MNIVITGDFCPIAEVEELCLSNKHSDIYGNVLPLLNKSDFSITNLECPITNKLDPIVKLGPNLAADPKCMDLLKIGGFDAVTLANNHIMDQGSEGLNSTMKLCDESNIKTVGAGENILEAEKQLYVDIHDQKLAIISCAENEFSIAGDNMPGAAHFNPIRLYELIDQAKTVTKNIIVIIHGGNEFNNLPSKRMVDNYRFIARLGVTAVVGHHTHCPSGYEFYNDVPIFYSLGNFLFRKPNLPKKDWEIGMLLSLDIDDGKVIEFELHPFNQCKKRVGMDLMEVEDKKKYLEYIEELSEIISDDIKLNKSWESFLAKKEMEYLPPLLTMNRIERFLLKRDLYFGHRIKNNRLLYLLNLIQCEAHRDVSIDIIKKWIK